MLACVEEQIACTTEARSSVSLQVLDEAGAVIPDLTVSYTVDGGASAACDNFMDGAWACGYEQVGTFEISVSAPGFETQTLSLVVEADVCHVITEVEEITLLSSCGDVEAMPSVIATVVGASGEPLEEVAVVYSLGDGPETACDPAGETWICGYGTAGTFDITASAAGHVPQNQTVVVLANECGVDTRNLDFHLDWAAD
jgi:hypothetical protein